MKFLLKISPILIVVIGVILIFVSTQGRELNASIAVSADSTFNTESTLNDNGWEIVNQGTVNILEPKFETFEIRKQVPPLSILWGIVVIVLGIGWGAWRYWILPGAKKAGGVY